MSEDHNETVETDFLQIARAQNLALPALIKLHRFRQPELTRGRSIIALN